LVGTTGALGLVRRGPLGQTGTLLRSEGPTADPFVVPLPIPPVARPLAGGGDRYEIVQREADVEILPGRTTRIRGYDGRFPGPTIRGRAGRPVEVTHVNELTIGTAVHLHGGHTPAESDGYPTDLILPASGARPGSHGHGHRAHGRHAGNGDTTVGRRVYRYPLDQRAATLWYHDHAMDFTGPNVYRGLAGFFIVSDDEDGALPLPRDERDLPLLICDRAFDGDGQLRYPALAEDQSRPGVEDRYMRGVLGDTILVNGAPWPVHDVSRTRHRLRLLNGSNARRYRLALDPPPPGGGGFTQVGTDGGLLEAPRRRDTITLAPGERADVVVDFSAYRAGTQVVLRNELGAGGTTGRVMRFDVVRDEPDDTAIPERLSNIEPLDPAEAVTTRTFRFQLRGAAGPDGYHQRWMINRQPFDPGHDHARPRLGDVEIWRFTTDVHHPVHVHLAHFQVLTRNGRGPGDGDRGWKDTIDLLPGETAEVVMRFTGYRGRYVLHCHNLEHEDMAMMANFTVI
jgi:spore coat protein A, manganese oxidase